MAQREVIIGIDLGTTNSVVAVMEGSEPVIIANQEGQRLTPSVVSFAADNEVLVGEPARRQAVTQPHRTVKSVKRLMGRRREELDDNEVSLLAFDICGEDQDYLRIRVDNQEYTPPEISASILRKLKEAAEAFLGTAVTKAVITVPAYFNDAQRHDTRNAGLIAGLQVERIVNEPTAAALAYGLDKAQEEKIAIFDLGGGTFDISILEVSQGVFDVIATSGDTHLGGDDFDQALMHFVAEEYFRAEGVELRNDSMALQRLNEACEKAKRELSAAHSTELVIPFITATAQGPKHLRMTITRAQFENLIEEIVERCREPVLRALADANLDPKEIDQVVLVGGSTRVPLVQRVVEDLFGRKPHKGINPDEVVAAGAAIQAGVLNGDVGNLVLLDVTPLTLGVETVGGVMSPVVERNTSIPTERKKVFTTADDDQTCVQVRVFQGERPVITGNRLLGEFNLEGIPPEPRGKPKIEVTFDIDVNGILNVSAKHLGSGSAQRVRIEQGSSLSPEQIESMRRAAEAHAQDDRERRKLLELRDQGDRLCYDTERIMTQYGERLLPAQREAVLVTIDRFRQAVRTQDMSAVQSAINQIQHAYNNLAGASPTDITSDLQSRFKKKG